MVKFKESLYEPEELARKYFVALYKDYDKTYNIPRYFIMNDGYFVKNVIADSDEEAIRKFNAEYRKGSLESKSRKVSESKGNKDIANEMSSTLVYCLDKFEETGKTVRKGCWQISNGGNDLWYEIYYIDEPVIKCVDGKVMSEEERYNDLAYKVAEYYGDDYVTESRSRKVNGRKRNLKESSFSEVLVDDISWCNEWTDVLSAYRNGDCADYELLPEEVVIPANLIDDEDEEDIIIDKVTDYLYKHYYYFPDSFTVRCDGWIVAEY